MNNFFNRTDEYIKINEIIQGVEKRQRHKEIPTENIYYTFCMTSKTILTEVI